MENDSLLEVESFLKPFGEVSLKQEEETEADVSNANEGGGIINFIAELFVYSTWMICVGFLGLPFSLKKTGLILGD